MSVCSFPSWKGQVQFFRVLQSVKVDLIYPFGDLLGQENMTSQKLSRGKACELRYGAVVVV